MNRLRYILYDLFPYLMPAAVKRRVLEGRPSFELAGFEPDFETFPVKRLGPGSCIVRCKELSGWVILRDRRRK